MLALVYEILFNTSIWIDLYENRIGFNEEPLGDYAFKLLMLIRKNNNVIILSDIVIQELESKYSIAQLNGMFKLFENIIEKVFLSKKQRDKAKIIAFEKDVPLGDVMHAVLARDNDATLITRDKHFNYLRDISEYRRPEDLI